MNSALYEGAVIHLRKDTRDGVDHRFRYSLFMVYLDLDELDTVFAKRWLWSTKRLALAWFRRADYFGVASVPLKDAVLDRVERDLGRRPRGAVRLLTQLRYYGLGFNPVSFYYCFDERGELDAIAVEITNTPWLERHTYVVDARVESGRARLRAKKEFHVSPFIDMDCDYDWSFSVPRDALAVHMKNERHVKNQQQGETFFEAILEMKRREMTGRSLARALFVHPWMTLKIVFGIYWQALVLHRKGATFYPHPKKRTAGLEASP